MIVKWAEFDMTILPLLLGVTIISEDCVTLVQPPISLHCASESELDCATKVVDSDVSILVSMEVTALAVDE